MQYLLLEIILHLTSASETIYIYILHAHTHTLDIKSIHNPVKMEGEICAVKNKTTKTT